ADRMDLSEEIRRGRRARAALVVEADLVRHRVVAEHDRELASGLADSPGPIKQLGIADMAAAIARDLTPEGASQALLVRCDPLDSMPRQKWDHRLTDRALARPHPPWPLAEYRLVLFDCAADLDLGVLRVAVLVRRQVHIRHRFAGQTFVEKERQGSGIVRGGW